MQVRAPHKQENCAERPCENGGENERAASVGGAHNFAADVDPVGRKQLPEFYGYIPEGTILFLCLVLNSTLMLLIRNFSAAMLLIVSRRYLVYCLAGW